MTTHTIRAEVEVLFTPASLTEIEAAYPKLDIEYSYTPGYPATGPSYASGGEPAEGAEITLIRATVVDGDGLQATVEDVNGWAERWLSDDGYDKACQLAEDEGGPDPDQARDAMRDDYMLDYWK